MKKLLLFGFVTLAAVIWMTGCSGEDCADCGPCGITGPPAASTGLQTTSVGKTSAGAPAVNLLYWSGETEDCTAEDTSGLVYDLSSDAVDQQADFVELTSDRDRVGEDGMHTWTQESLELSVEQMGERSLSLTFVRGDQQVAVECNVDQNDTINCS